jgi:hypothetical protein
MVYGGSEDETDNWYTRKNRKWNKR